MCKTTLSILIFKLIACWQHSRVAKACAYDQHCLGSKPTHANLLCPWERNFLAIFPAWWSWQAVLNYNHISIKLQADSNILASPEAGWGNCLPYVLASLSLSYESRE